MNQARKLWGLDYTSAPTRRKPICCMSGELADSSDRLLKVQSLQRWEHSAQFQAALNESGPWLAVLDLPFGLPRELVDQLDLGSDWVTMAQRVSAWTRPQWVDQLRAFCAPRPVGQKFAHRACDRPAGSSPSMKWVNPPVALMLHSALPALLASGVHLPGLRSGDLQRVAIEGYPGLLARSVLGRRSYKSDDRAKQDASRHQSRVDLMQGLLSPNNSLGIELDIDEDLKAGCIDDPSGDAMDALLCLIQAAWCEARRDEGRHGFGLPDSIDPVEGWIATAVPEA